MTSFRVLDQRVRYMFAAGVLLVASIIPAIASAAQVTERSIELSSSTKGATNVTYNINFTPAGSAGAFVVDFCSNSPLIGAECDEPLGFSATTATSTTSGFTAVSALDANTVRVTGTITAPTPVVVALTGITNPTNTGPLYARIVTYDTAANANLYTSQSTITSGTGGVVDMGGAAMSITDKISVSGAVLETMTFCVSGGTIAENCGGTLTAPVLKLGQDTGGVIALNSNDVYTGTVYTQISTNAVNGAVVRLKSSAADCGGLVRAGATTNTLGCGIVPAQQTGITPGQAKFGVKTADAAGVGSSANGTLQPVTGSGYNNDTYALNYNGTDQSTGVTSTYGDGFLDTNNTPVNNMGMALTFGASVANNTPAGLYSADLSLVATGKF